MAELLDHVMCQVQEEAERGGMSREEITANLHRLMNEALDAEEGTTHVP
jgi:hypothetical protein